MISMFAVRRLARISPRRHFASRFCCSSCRRCSEKRSPSCRSCCNCRSSWSRASRTWRSSSSSSSTSRSSRCESARSAATIASKWADVAERYFLSCSRHSESPRSRACPWDSERSGSRPLSTKLANSSLSLDLLRRLFGASKPTAQLIPAPSPKSGTPNSKTVDDGAGKAGPEKLSKCWSLPKPTSVGPSIICQTPVSWSPNGPKSSMAAAIGVEPPSTPSPSPPLSLFFFFCCSLPLPASAGVESKTPPPSPPQL
mmetsp:Transcript_65560/g.182247  ORF Transcript_65560/g.182247 Transcript_65560/m.182247 type:complete len:256 (+) Transcript_65560:589-1356(+)